MLMINNFQTKNPAFAEFFADLNVIRDPGLSSNISIANQNILSIEETVDNFKVVEMRGFAPRRPWMISPTSHYAIPTTIKIIP